MREQDSQLAPQVVKIKKAKKVGQIKAVGAGLEGFEDWVDPISSELAEGKEMICLTSLLDLSRG